MCRETSNMRTRVKLIQFFDLATHQHSQMTCTEIVCNWSDIIAELEYSLGVNTII